MSKRTRVIFNFDERSLAELERQRRCGGHETMGEALRDSLSVFETIVNLRQEGFTEVAVRNPRTRDERILLLPQH